MRLYLVQHGDAVDKSVDPERPLSAEGERDVRAVAAFLRNGGVAFGEVWESGKTRARQTAGLLAEVLGGHIETREGLAPQDPVKPVAKLLRGREEDLTIVGHLPHLGDLAGLLLAHAPEMAPLAFQRGAVVCLEGDSDEGWRVMWMVTPSLVQGA